MLATTYERRTLLLLLPPLVAFELAMLAIAAADGWVASKLRGYRWLWAHRRWISAHRRTVQQVRTVGDADIAPLLTAKFDATVIALPRITTPLNAAMQVYWSWARARLRRPAS